MSSSFLIQYIENYARPIIFFINVLRLKNSHLLGFDLKKQAGVETKQSQDVTISAGRFSAPERDVFASMMSLFPSFCLLQFWSPLFSFFWFVPGVIKGY